MNTNQQALLGKVLRMDFKAMEGDIKKFSPLELERAREEAGKLLVFVNFILKQPASLGVDDLKPLGLVNKTKVLKRLEAAQAALEKLAKAGVKEEEKKWSLSAFEKDSQRMEDVLTRWINRSPFNSDRSRGFLTEKNFINEIGAMTHVHGRLVKSLMNLHKSIDEAAGAIKGDVEGVVGKLSLGSGTFELKKRGDDVVTYFQWRGRDFSNGGSLNGNKDLKEMLDWVDAMAKDAGNIRMIKSRLGDCVEVSKFIANLLAQVHQHSKTTMTRGKNEIFAGLKPAEGWNFERLQGLVRNGDGLEIVNNFQAGYGKIEEALSKTSTPDRWIARCTDLGPSEIAAKLRTLDQVR